MEQQTLQPRLIVNVLHQPKYSRGELLLRTLFGSIYIAFPHLFLLFFINIASGILSFIAWWIVLFTGAYPLFFFNFQMGRMRWMLRLQARIWNLADGYPAFGLEATDDKTILDLPYPASLSRGLLLLRLFLGFIYVIIPHGFLLFFRIIATFFVSFIAWWIVLFTGQYPKGMHDFVVGTLRWGTRVMLYMSFLTDTYPPFSGK